MPERTVGWISVNQMGRDEAALGAGRAPAQAVKASCTKGSTTASLRVLCGKTRQ